MSFPDGIQVSVSIVENLPVVESSNIGSGNDIWIIATTNNSDKFDEKQIHEIIHSFKFKNIDNSPLEFQSKYWYDSIIDFFKSLFA